MTAPEKALAFRLLHAEGVLVLPNAWDVASARLIEEAGARALATTSGGVAWSLGAPDGQRLPRDRAVDLVARIVAAVDVPVTADVEGGYGLTADELAGTVRAVTSNLTNPKMAVFFLAFCRSSFLRGRRPPSEPPCLGWCSTRSPAAGGSPTCCSCTAPTPSSSDRVSSMRWSGLPVWF